MGLQDRVLPFSLALFLCSSMSHEDAARIHLGFGPVRYAWPCFAGDTFTKTVTVESIRNTSDGSHAVSTHGNNDNVSRESSISIGLSSYHRLTDIINLYR